MWGERSRPPHAKTPRFTLPHLRGSIKAEAVDPGPAYGAEEN